MTHRTGDHDARRNAARAEPSPITALRDMLATAFAADVAAVTPIVADVLREELGAQASPGHRDTIRQALAVLANNPSALAMEVAQVFRARFDMKISPGEDPLSRTSAIPFSRLSLMDDSALRLDLALDQCSARLKEQTAAECFQLSARVAEMLGKPSLQDVDNPILPRDFARSLLGALANMGFDTEQQLAVFKAFGPAMLNIAPDLYMHANSLLVDLGVLADFRESYGRPVNRATAPATSNIPAGLPTDAVALAAILDRLLSGSRAAHI